MQHMTRQSDPDDVLMALIRKISIGVGNMKGRKYQPAWVLLVIALIGCGTPSQRGVSDSTGAAPPRQEERNAVPSQLPQALIGVWYPEGAEGMSQCERYRALPENSAYIDATVVSLVGSLIVRPNLIHAVAEYGEGNFYVVAGVEPKSPGVWRVATHLGIDALPPDTSRDTPNTSLISLQAERLRWQPTASHGGAPAYFRCGAVRDDTTTLPNQ